MLKVLGKRRQQIRVLSLIEASSISGTAKPVLEFAREARRESTCAEPVDVHVGVFARGDKYTDNPLTRTLKSENIPFTLLQEKRRFDPAPIAQIRALVAEHQIDVIWTNSVKSHFLVYLASADNSCKWVAFHHGYTSTDLKMHAYNQLDRISLLAADRVLTVCRPFAGELAARGVDTRKITVQHMPIRTFACATEGAAALRKEFDLGASEKIILNVARLSKEKDHPNLLRAFALLHQQTGGDCPRLFIVGDGVERMNLIRQAASLGIENRVIFTGQRNDVLAFYALAELFVLSSASEGTPNALLEAMAAGVPTVATSVGGVPELIVHGRDGLLVPQSNSSALAEAMRTVIGIVSLKEELIVGGKHVVGTHTPRWFYLNMRQIFSDVLSGVSESPSRVSHLRTAIR